MLRQRIQRIAQLTTGINIRSCSSDVTWSTGEKTHPSPPDCPMGNKGEYPQKLPDGGIQYFGFQYYPRHPDEVDPPYEPAPLHLVTRVRSLQGKPWWEKDVMKKIGLDGKRSQYAVLKNNPENNAHLWKVKHLIQIVPIQLPKDLPEDADPNHCFLKETGEFVYTPHITVNQEDFKEGKEIARTKWPRRFTEKYTRKNWEYPWQLKLC